MFRFETQQGHSITFMGRTFNFHSDSLHPRYKWILANSEGKLTKAFMRVKPVMDSFPIHIKKSFLKKPHTKFIITLNLLFSPKLFYYV